MRQTYASGVYCIIDQKTGEPAGTILQLHKHEAVAVRGFAEAVSDPATPLAKWPDDFSLVRLGWVIVEEDGTFKAHIEPEFRTIITARQVIETLATQTPSTESNRR